MKTHYEHLGVPQDASQEQITKAFRRLAMRWHPDRNHNSPQSEEKFKQIKDSYEVLKNPQKRKRYDEELRQNQPFKKEEELHVTKEIDLIISFWESVIGTTKRIHFKVGKDDFHADLKIPPGVERGQEFKILAANHVVVAKAYITPQEGFWREGLDVVSEVEISYLQAILGAELKVPHWEEEELTLRIPAGTQHAGRVVVPNKGIKKDIFVGDRVFVCKVLIPSKLTPQQKELLLKLQELEND